ncbi:MAG: hypothetical protein QNK37_21650 [Acidobacteriota bacterium]|nr:hypothetical protein [Acidobacteriota bacterium]
MTNKVELIDWHEPFAEFLELLLNPVGIEVLSEIQVMSKPPRADILLLRNVGPHTEEQRQRLCDAVRDSHASHIFIEFKYSETITEAHLIKAPAYGIFYRESKKLKPSEVDTFIVSSKTPSSQLIEDAGYRWAEEGILRSQIPGFRMTPIISLNDLPNTPHNLLFKVFASKLKQKRLAFDKIKDRRADVMSGELSALIIGLQKIMLSKEFEMATETITSEEIKRIGMAYAKRMMKDFPVEERLEGVPFKERLKGVPLEERLKGVPLEERLKGVPLEERLKGVPLEERLEDVSDEELLRLLEARRKAGRNH